MADSKVVPVLATAEQTEEQRAAQDAEYGTYVAIAPIAYNGVMAYLPGDPVPVSNVERHGYDDSQVAKIANKAGQEVIAAVHAAATSQGVSELAAPVSLGVSVAESK